jgi:quercetin dioxygenase-like cupin family protein
MQIYNLENFKRGWICGGFSPSLFKSDIEIGIHSYPSGTVHQAHYHKLASEFNIVTNGTCLFRFMEESNIEDVYAKKGDIVLIEPYEIVEFVATNDCDLTVIKTSSNPNDKYLA